MAGAGPGLLKENVVFTHTNKLLLQLHNCSNHFSPASLKQKTLQSKKEKKEKSKMFQKF